MKCVSGTRPPEYELRQDNNECLVLLSENVQEKIIPGDEGESEIEYSFDRYSITVPYRDNLEQDIAAEPAKWLLIAKEKEIEELSAKIRKKRNELLAESDNAFCIDRICHDITDISTTTFTEKLKELADSPITKYRQALRDIPEQEGFPYKVVWPTKPQQ